MYPLINMTKDNTYHSGFTLLEMIIYIFLFSIMIGGLIMTSFLLVQNSHNTENIITAQGEMNFVLKKIDWLINQTKYIHTPIPGHPSNILLVETYTGDNIEIKYDNTNKKIFLAGNDITTINVKVDELTFTTIDENPKGIKIDLIIDGQKINYIKYLKNI